MSPGVGDDTRSPFSDFSASEDGLTPTKTPKLIGAGRISKCNHDLREPSIASPSPSSSPMRRSGKSLKQFHKSSKKIEAGLNETENISPLKLALQSSSLKLRRQQRSH